MCVQYSFSQKQFYSSDTQPVRFYGIRFRLFHQTCSNIFREKLLLTKCLSNFILPTTRKPIFIANKSFTKSAEYQITFFFKCSKYVLSLHIIGSQRFNRYYFRRGNVRPLSNMLRQVFSIHLPVYSFHGLDNGSYGRLPNISFLNSTDLIPHSFKQLHCFFLPYTRLIS